MLKRRFFYVLTVASIVFLDDTLTVTLLELLA